MQQIFIRLANLSWLVLVLIGVPAITGRNLGWLRLSDSPLMHRLIMWGLALGMFGNVCGAIYLARGPKPKKLCWQWFTAFALILTVEYLFVRHYINFNWLKEFLLWAKAKAIGGNR